MNGHISTLPVPGAPALQTRSPAGTQPRSLPSAAVLTLGLLACVWSAVLAFGATLPLAWSAVQIVAFALLGLLLWGSAGTHPALRFPWKAPASLLLFLALQSALLRPSTDRAGEEFLSVLALASVFCVSAAVARLPSWRSCLLHGLIALGLFQAMYGLVQSITGWQYIFTYKKFFYSAQATGTYINPNHFAGLLELILPISLAFSLKRLDQVHAHPRSVGSFRFLRSERSSSLIFYSFITLLLFAGILLSRSRMGMLSIALTTLTMGFLWLGRSARSGRRPSIFLLPAVAILFSLWLGLGPLLARYSSWDADFYSRLSVWKDSLVLIRSHPILGTGLGTFADSFTRVQTTHLGRTVDHAHNDYLEFAVECGAPGASLLFGMIISLFLRTARACRSSMKSDSYYPALACTGSILALLVHSLTDFNLQIPANAFLFAVILGLAATLTARRPALVVSPPGGAA